MAKTLWSKEIAQKEREKRNEIYRRVVGKEPPARFIDSKIRKVRMDVVELLTLAGYKKLGRGWVRQFEDVYRYHIYQTDEKELWIHCDKDKVSEKGKKYHVASQYKVKEEKKRIRALQPKVPQNLPRPKKPKISIIAPNAAELQKMKLN